jgi:protein ImuB
MARRIIAVALPHLAAEARLRREGQAGFPRPFAIAGQEGGALRLASVNPAAAALGLAPGLGLADARAICPTLVTRPEEPERLAAFRRGLARWAARFSPVVSAENGTGVTALSSTPPAARICSAVKRPCSPPSPTGLPLTASPPARPWLTPGAPPGR